MLNIMIVLGSNRPVPATLGGATQTMISNMIEVNELEHICNFTICSFYEKNAYEASKQNSFTKIMYYHPNHIFDRIFTLPYRVLRKLSGGRTYIKTNFIRWCIKQIRDVKPDVVVIEGNYFQTLQLAKVIQVPLILHMHIDGLSPETDNAIKIVNACTGILVISEYCRKRVASIDSKSKDKILIVRNTIDIDRFSPVGWENYRDKIRYNYGINASSKVAMYCGRIHADKGVLELINAFLSLEDPNVYLLIVGGSAYKDSKKMDSYESSLHKLAQGYPNVIFTGYIEQADLPGYYAAADLVCVPSKWQEAAGNVTIEAMACGRPVIASSQGGIPEYADSKCCVLVDYDEKFEANLTEGLRKYFYDDRFYKEKAKYARTAALAYDKMQYLGHYFNAVSQLLEGDR